MDVSEHNGIPHHAFPKARGGGGNLKVLLLNHSGTINDQRVKYLCYYQLHYSLRFTPGDQVFI